LIARGFEGAPPAQREAASAVASSVKNRQLLIRWGLPGRRSHRFAGKVGGEGDFLAIWDSTSGLFLIRFPRRFGEGRSWWRSRDYRQADLLRPSLEQIIDMGHPLVRLAGKIDWGFLDRRFGEVYAAGDGQPPLPVRLIAGLFILKPMHSLSDEALCARWVENPYFRYF
jgi:hypothetical protein